MIRWLGWVVAAAVALTILGGVLTVIWLWLVLMGGETAPWPDWPF